MTKPEGRAGLFATPERGIALVAGAAVALQATAALAFAWVHDFDLGRTTQLASLAGRDAGVANAFRWALLVDMLGYLAVAPLILHLHARVRAAQAALSSRRELMLTVGTGGGLLFSLAGAGGAALLAAGAPPLIEAAAAGGPAAEPASVTFAALSSAVYVGLWGPLEWLGLGVWLCTLGVLVRGVERPFAWLTALAGIGAIAYAARVGLAGRNPVESGDLIDFIVLPAIGLFVVFEAMLAVRLWLGR